MKILSIFDGRTQQRCSCTCVPSPTSKSQYESRTRSAVHEAPRAGDGKHAPDPRMETSMSAPDAPHAAAVAAAAASTAGTAHVVSTLLIASVANAGGLVAALARVGRVAAGAGLAADCGSRSAGKGGGSGAACISACVAACVADSTISACNSRGASTALVPLNGRERAAHSAFSSSLLRIFSRCAAEPSQATSKLGIPVAVESTIDARKDGMLGLSSGTSAASAKVTTRITVITRQELFE